VLEYVENREAYIGRGLGLVLTGSRGTGKTLLANLLVKDLISHGVTCYATTFSDMIESFAEGWRDREVSRWFSQRVRNAQVLLIDDLGRERNKGPESVGDNMLESTIRYRVANNLPTLITTNLTEADVGTGYGGHTMSLLSEKAIFLPVPGADARKHAVPSRAMKEIRLGINQRPVVIG
jgi:DNA replication protein DnaC